MGGYLYVPGRHYQLEIDGLAFNAPNRKAMNLQVLGGGSNKTGSDLKIPGVDGMRARRRSTVGTDHDIHLILAGDIDDTGALTANPHEALDDLIDLFAALSDSPTVGATKDAAYTRRSGSPITKPIVPLGFEVGAPAGPWRVNCVFSLSIPSGRF